jgi:hypothetical protein
MHNFAHFRKSTRSFFAVAVAIVSIIPAARCQCDRPATSGWTGSAYHGDWFTYQLKAAYADGTMQQIAETYGVQAAIIAQ